MTAQELTKIAHEVNYFGDSDTLYAFEDGNMYNNIEQAEQVKKETGKQFHVIKKGAKSVEVEMPTEIKEDIKEVKKSKKDK